MLSFRCLVQYKVWKMESLSNSCVTNNICILKGAPYVSNTCATSGMWPQSSDGAATAWTVISNLIPRVHPGQCVSNVCLSGSWSGRAGTAATAPATDTTTGGTSSLGSVSGRGDLAEFNKLHFLMTWYFSETVRCSDHWECGPGLRCVNTWCGDPAYHAHYNMRPGAVFCNYMVAFIDWKISA